MDIGLILLRLVHILAGIFWAGGAVISAALLVPAVRALGPDGAKFMQQFIGKQKFSVYMSIGAILTVVAGSLLFWRDSNGLQAAWIFGPTGLMLTIGALAGIAGFLIGLLVSGPTATQVETLGKAMQTAGGPPKPEQIAAMQKLQMRLGQAGIWGALLLVVSSAAMAIARSI